MLQQRECVHSSIGPEHSAGGAASRRHPHCLMRVGEAHSLGRRRWRLARLRALASCYKRQMKLLKAQESALERVGCRVQDVLSLLRFSELVSYVPLAIGHPD